MIFQDIDMSKKLRNSLPFCAILSVTLNLETYNKTGEPVREDLSNRKKKKELNDLEPNWKVQLISMLDGSLKI